MPVETTLAERAIHLALFVSGAAAVALGALAAIERLADGGRTVVRGSYVLAAAGVFVVVFVVERLYHAL